MVQLKRNGDIVHKGNRVGVLDWNGNTLVDIFIDKQYRRNGYASEAINQMIKYIKQEGYDYVQTTSVVNTGMEILLQKKNFTPKPDGPIDVPDKFEHSSGVTIPQDTTPIQNDNCWIKIF